ncbi:MAG: PrsW family intramembrane metalloprotease [Flavobacteriaceae bacterium]|nr:PrsW family intramembrane metalloprotease [Bacteroidia bacterium]MBT8287723.1 PrsW family intramembrane metalloprotease [Bacteroidia bacterium]NNF73920.1 PrsW family intramembrane metalloprotease [Flavobacteriaceae bacterium]NNK71854.1 PrsW family intramembrane metalloprotease [Flavobacteriaceae bacterium]
MQLLILIILALSPGVMIMIYMYLQDKHEPEPMSQLLRAFGLGVLSMLLASGVTYLIYKNLHLEKGSMADMAVKAFLVVALVEEGSKFLFIRGFLYPNKNFNEPFDGIIYSLMVGMGFAMTENIIYVINGDGGTAILRMFTAVPAHAVFAIIMGFYLGEAQLEEKPSTLYASIGLIAATLMHGIYDYFLFLSFVPGLWIGAIVSLILGYFISRKAIELHQDASPFKIDKEDEEI